MKLLFTSALLTLILLTTLCQVSIAQRLRNRWSDAPNVIEQDNDPGKRLHTYRLKTDDTYTQTYLNDRLGSTLQIRTRQRFSFAQIAKVSLPFLAGAAYGIFGGRPKSFGQEVSLGSATKGHGSCLKRGHLT